MRASQFLLATIKESPQDAELISHQLMLRAGLIRKLASGLYSWLPLGLKVLRKVENIVRKEMDAIGAQELLMPAIQPAELWEETGRWSVFGPQLLKIVDRHKRAFCFGPTHEEVITDIMRNELKSYRDLPCCFYQIQTKFRDEIRPRFGVMRAREFLMKDAYSFHIDKDSLDQTYQKMHGAYCQIFSSLGLDFKTVLADSGAIGGSVSEEFHVLADSGEDAIAYCKASDYAANVETAQALKPQQQPSPPSQARRKVATPNIKSVTAQADYMGLPPEQIIKTLLVKGSKDDVVALLLRGNDDLNPLKAEKHDLVYSPLTMVDEETVQRTAHCQPGFVGPISLEIPIIADFEVLGLSDFSCGANENDQHYCGVNWVRDIPIPAHHADLRVAKSGDMSPCGQGQLEICRGIEVGHIFQLGDKYSQSMQATVLDDKGKKALLQMGCYGIGVSRIVAAAIEQNHDAQGIIWPTAMAPFHIVLIPMAYHKSARVKEATDELYKQLTADGFEVLLDDRQERPGRMFAESDLIGIPHRLVLSEKTLDAEKVEYKNRREPSAELIDRKQLSIFLKAKVFN